MPNHRISRESKEDICRLLDSGIITRREAAERAGIPYSSLCKIYKSYCEHGNCLPAYFNQVSTDCFQSLHGRADYSQTS